MVPTGFPNTKFFNLKNETNRVVIAYQIQNPLPEILTFKEPVGFLTDKHKLFILIKIKLSSEFLYKIIIKTKLKHNNL